MFSAAMCLVAPELGLGVPLDAQAPARGVQPQPFLFPSLGQPPPPGDLYLRLHALFRAHVLGGPLISPPAGLGSQAPSVIV